MSRSLHLGSEGEDTARHLCDVYDFSGDFVLWMLVSPYEPALAEMRRRLAEVADDLVPFEADDGLAQRLRAFVEERDRDQRLVVWLQQKHYDPKTWSRNLGFLQGRRDVYVEEAPWMWVLAGPPDLFPLASRYATHLATGMSLSRLDEEPRPLPRTTAPIRWLHLSDFHFAALERWDRRKTLKALLRHAERLRADGLAPDFVFVTGDVAGSGKRKEYEQAERFFTELAKTLGIEPNDAFFFVPGNHDVDRDAIGTVDGYITSNLRSQEAIEDVFGDAAAMQLLGRRLEGFYTFTERFLGPARGWQRQRPWRVDVRERGGVAVAVLQLNSAWTSGSQKDDKDLLVGAAQVDSALEEAGDVHLRIALVHHPLADLADVDRAPLESLYGSGDVHFLLRGHLHRTRTGRLANPDGTLVELAAGATYTSDRWPRRYLLSEIDLAGGEARIHLFLYSDEGKGFWAKDTLAYENVPDGVWTLPLDPALRLDGESPEPAPATLTNARRATLTARYRTAAATVHGSARFVGFADHRPRPNVSVPELFVPLRFEQRGYFGAGSKPAYWTTARLLRGLLQGDESGPGRFVVLGDPGSGKTTLCRFASVALTGAASIEGLDVAEDVLPLFLPFREYVRERRENKKLSIIDFLTEQAGAQLQVNVSESFLQEALDDGRAILLLDGLDEVGSVAERESMRGSIQGFCGQYPKVAALLTSRIAGYNEAPLSQEGADAFMHLTIVPFDHDDLRQFVTHWYAAREPTDPLARDRGVADLQAVLDAGPHVRELARNPMLATLVALVHRYEAHLPGERAALYDICVKTFLDTWPEARRKTFQEIDSRLQRVYLETLAYRMQCSRSHDYRDVTVERAQLIDDLIEILSRHEGSSASPEETRGLVERWVQFLEKGSGLLVEQRPGVFSFFHLSLMEYLAARGLNQAEIPEDTLAERFDNPVWREVCLLAVGDRATEKAFLDRLFADLRERPGGWSFLLRCVREEAAFNTAQRSAIFLEAGRDLLRRSMDSWSPAQQTLDEVLSLSDRHAKRTTRWLRERLGADRGEDLRGLVALRLKDPEVGNVLAGRQDAAEAAADLLEYWPGTKVGDWAAATVSTSAAFTWGRTSPGELLVLRSLAVAGIESLTSGLLVGLLRNTGAHASLASDADIELAERKRPGEGRGLPSGIRIQAGREPSAIEIRILPVNAPILHAEDHDCLRKTPRPFSQESSLVFSRDFSRRFSPDLTRYFSPGFPLEFCRYFSRLAEQPFSEYFFSRAFRSRLSRDIARDFSRDFPRALKNFRRSFSSTLTSQATISLSEPATPRTSPDLDAWARDRETEDDERFKRLLSLAFARLAGEAWAAAITAVDRAKEEKIAYAHRRVENAWLLHVWPAVDERFAGTSSPDRQALYLTLGFTQATTTWQWPWTDPWRELLGGDPPAHWLPRSQWHLCWLLYASELPEGTAEAGVHRRGLDEALVEGLDDAERPGVAKALRELLPPEA